jgi:hypothetical protein
LLPTFHLPFQNRLSGNRGTGKRCVCTRTLLRAFRQGKFLPHILKAASETSARHRYRMANQNHKNYFLKETLMKLQTVNSSMIHAIGYDAKTKSLEVIFNSGRTYVYEDVPRQIYRELMAASSKGQFMRNAVIDCYFCYQVSQRRRR